jgi:DNA-binding GntR family transcriptional regulator
MAELKLHLDRSSPVPLYHQVARELEAAIERGDLGQGDRLENETDLAERLHLSRPTIRRAIQELVDKGLLVRKRGVGTQVLNSQLRRRMKLTSLYDDLLESGRRPKTEILGLEHAPASQEIADRLGLAPDTEVVQLERIRYADDVPLAIMHNWLPVEIAGELTRDPLEEAGLYAWLRDRGVRFRVADQRVGARAASPHEASLLECADAAPLVTMERIAFDDYGRTVEYASHVYEASRYSLEITLVDT